MSNVHSLPQPNPISSTVPVSWKAIAAVMVTLSVFVIALGLTYPLIALILEKEGVSEVVIGLNAAMSSVGVIVSSPMVPWLAERIGAWRIGVICALITVLLFILFGAIRVLAVWFVLRFVLGLTISGLFIISETWINQLVTDETRGRVMGVYATVLSIGFAVGPFLIPLTGTEGWLPFLVGAGSALIAFVVLLLVKDAVPDFATEKRQSIFKFFPLAPVLLAVVATVALFEQAALSFLPVYGLRLGLTEITVAYALGILIVGNIFLQYPIGWLADKVSRRTVMLLCTVLSVVGCLILPWVIVDSWLLWPLLFVWGGATFGVYTIALIELGHRFSGALLLTGNAAYGLMWGVGGIIGSPLTGGAIRIFGPIGFPWLLALVYGMLTILVLMRWRPDY